MFCSKEYQPTSGIHQASTIWPKWPPGCWGCWIFQPKYPLWLYPVTEYCMTWTLWNNWCNLYNFSWTQIANKDTNFNARKSPLERWKVEACIHFTSITTPPKCNTYWSNLSFLSIRTLMHLLKFCSFSTVDSLLPSFYCYLINPKLPKLLHTPHKTHIMTPNHPNNLSSPYFPLYMCM